ncbi:MAG: hypothetical protein GAK29_05044 [Acinetobacter bereziniae]|uniref:Uncharacterized protein n=1 Tax=Acinetobacter bereziniae TaxID=106648 RepID=A0A833P9K8_ACIBZ|nr:MAG: hypothetical protein GAK29_05044 [Acinetobacter bereziniae]
MLSLRQTWYGSGYAWRYSFQIKNNSKVGVRLEHIFIPLNQNNVYVVFSENPTVIMLDEKHNGVCLSANLSPVETYYLSSEFDANDLILAEDNSFITFEN